MRYNLLIQKTFLQEAFLITEKRRGVLSKLGEDWDNLEHEKAPSFGRHDNFL